MEKQFTPLEKDSLIRFLEHHFSKHQNALLILDDVYDKKIIKAFDFKCKTLVLTIDSSVLDGRINKEKIRVRLPIIFHSATLLFKKICLRRL